MREDLPLARHVRRSRAATCDRPGCTVASQPGSRTCYPHSRHIPTQRWALRHYFREGQELRSCHTCGRLTITECATCRVTTCEAHKETHKEEAA